MSESINPVKVVQSVVTIAGAIGTVASVLSFLLGMLGNYYPPALKWAMRASDIGLRLHGFGSWVASLLPGGQPPALAQAKSFRPRPSLTEMCPTCGAPMTETPATLPTGAKQ